LYAIIEWDIIYILITCYIVLLCIQSSQFCHYVLLALAFQCGNYICLWCRDLAAKDANGKSDPYAHVKFQGHRQHTQVEPLLRGLVTVLDHVLAI